MPALTAIKAEVTPWEAAREVLSLLALLVQKYTILTQLHVLKAIDTVLLYVANILDNPQDDKFKVHTDADACSRMLTDADVCRMLTYADVC